MYREPITQHYKIVMLLSAISNMPTMIMVFVKRVQVTCKHYLMTDNCQFSFFNFVRSFFIMNKHTIHKMIAIVAVSCIGFISASAFAGQDSFQRDMIQRIQQSKLKLQQAEAAKGFERQKLMGEHMKMMQDTMNKMHAIKPKANMTMQEHEDYINEHQKLMEQMMEQMMGEHKLMMDMGDMHKQ